MNLLLIGYHYPVYADTQSPQGPIINDPTLKAQVVFRGLNFPTSMAFLGPNDILVLEKNDGTVRRIVNGTMLPNPVLHVNVDNKGERGLLGIAVTKNKNNSTSSIINTYTFLYFTEKINKSILSLNFQRNQSGTFPSYLNGSPNCQHLFKCTTISSTTGWKHDNGETIRNDSLQVSTNTTNKNMWSWIYGKEIDVNPGENYQVQSHMKLNGYTAASHMAIQGHNGTIGRWYQITHCPSDTNGPLEWHEYSCNITIPKDTTKIRPVLNAGWSSQPGKQAVTLFDDIYLSKISKKNRLYRYELIDSELTHPKLMMSLPATSIFHNGGKIIIGPDKNVYILIGDLDEHTKAANMANGTDEDGTAGIIRITQDGKPVGKGILGDKYPLNLYYGYGIRNGFGIDFDPITKKLWDTENGPEYGDEINLVEPGFNSGWRQMQGISETNGTKAGPITLTPKNIVDFQGKGKYRPPEFTWYSAVVGPTGIKFLNSDKLGKQYQNDMFVGDFHFGNLYHFKLNQYRTGLLLNGSLAFVKLDDPNNIQSIVFGHGFGGITDVQVGPDGYLYVLSLYAGGNNCDPIHPRPCIQYESSLPGTIFRIVPMNSELVPGSNSN